MLDPQAQSLGIGGALFLGALALLLKYRPWERKNNNSKKNSAGERDTSFWTAEIGRIIDEKLAAHDVVRNEALRVTMAAVLESKWAARNEDFRRILIEVLSQQRKK